MSIVESLFVGYSQRILLLSLLVLNIGIVMLASYLQGESRNKTNFSGMGYFNVGGYIFTVFITIGYSLFVLGYYAKFPFSCEDLSNASTRVVHFFTNPLTTSVENIKASTRSLFSTKVKDIAAIGQNISLQTKQSRYSLFITKFNTLKKNFIDQTLQNNTTVNMGICDYTLGELNKIYANPGFQTSVIILMFLVFYGFIRIVFRAMTVISFLIFELLFLCKAYHITTRMKEVEELE